MEFIQRFGWVLATFQYDFAGSSAGTGNRPNSTNAKNETRKVLIKIRELNRFGRWDYGV